MTLGMRRTAGRRAVLGALATTGLAGCQQLGRIKNPPHFSRGEGTWTHGVGDVTAQTWPMARCDAYQSGAAPQNTGPEPPLERLWTADIGDNEVAPPVVADGRVFAANRYPGRLVALDAKTGEQQWHHETDVTLTADLAVTDGTVYAHEGHHADDQPEVVRALDATTGHTQWTYELAYPRGNTLISGDKTLYLTVDDRLVALDASPGTLAWRYKPGSPHRRVSSVALGPETVYATAHSNTYGVNDAGHPVAGTVFELDPAAGEVTWSVDLRQPTGLAVAGDCLLVRDVDVLYAFERKTGEQRWQADLRPHEWRRIKRIAHFAVADGLVYHQTAPAGAPDGAAIAAVSLADGTERERYDLGYAGAATWTPVPSIAGDRLYAITEADEPRIDVLDLARGTRLAPAEENEQGSALPGSSSPAVADGSVFLGGEDGQVRALGPA